MVPGEGTVREFGMVMYTLLYLKWITNGKGREVGLGFRMGNMCTPVADSFQCMANQYNIVISLQLNKFILKNINSSVLSFLYNPTLTYIHDYWKTHSFD